MSRAVLIEKTGGPEVLRVVEVDEPHAGPGEVRVAVRAAGLNPYDSKVRTGEIPVKLPRGQGNEFAGVVDEVGADVSALDPAAPKIGDEVLGWTMSNAQAEFVVVASTKVARKPAALDWAIAGGIGLVANTAWRATSSLSLTSDDTVLITGVAGGVGILSAQFAIQAGATVIGTSRREHHDFLRGIGVIPVAYGPGDIDRLKHAAPGGYTAALDNVGNAGVEQALALGIPASRINSVAARDAVDKYGIGGVGGGKKSSEELEGFAIAAAAGALRLPVRATFPLDKVSAAYELLENSHGIGKVVLVLP